METTERIVESYVRYVKGWATIPNIRCELHEIDLLAIDLITGERYHIESGVSVSRSYSGLNNKQFNRVDLKTRGKTAGQRRTLGYFLQQKFNAPCVVKSLKAYGFRRGKYQKIIVSWGWDDGVLKRAKRAKVELWDFRHLLHEIADSIGSKRSYFTDDTFRTLHLVARANQLKMKSR